jgi:rubrerythrin
MWPRKKVSMRLQRYSGVPVRWVCRNCGYVHEGTEAPDVCPACAHPQSHYELEAVNY